MPDGYVEGFHAREEALAKVNPDRKHGLYKNGITITQKVERDWHIYQMKRDGYRLKDIADEVGLCYRAVKQIARSIEKQLEQSGVKV